MFGPRKVVPFAAALVASLLITASGNADRAVVACGALVTEDVTLTHDVTDCEQGVILEGENITLDLNGHTISGKGTGTGISFSAAPGMTIKNGRVDRFEIGVFFGASNATITQMVVSNNSKQGIVDWSFGATVTNSLIAHNGESGVELAGGGDFALVRNNTVVYNGLDGIQAHVFADGGTYDHNRTSRNGRYGIRAFDAVSRITGNVSTRNASSGIFAHEELPRRAGYFIADNVANRNGAFGIEVSGYVFGEFGGSPDGGGNSAKLNADPRECLNIVCSHDRDQDDRADIARKLP